MEESNDSLEESDSLGSLFSAGLPGLHSKEQWQVWGLERTKCLHGQNAEVSAGIRGISILQHIHVIFCLPFFP